MPSLDSICLIIIVIQGFGVWFHEWDLWRMSRDRYKERAKWREAKRKSQTKSAESRVSDAGKTIDGPTKCTTPSEKSKDGSAEPAESLPKKGE